MVFKVARRGRGPGPIPSVEVVTPFEDTHFGTRLMTVRDPDGRVWSVQAPAPKD